MLSYPQKEQTFRIDRGSEHTCAGFTDAGKLKEILASLSFSGCCTGNAYVESLFHALIIELRCGEDAAAG